MVDLLGAPLPVSNEILFTVLSGMFIIVMILFIFALKSIKKNKQANNGK